MSPSGKASNKILGVITPARAEAFLLRLANRRIETVRDATLLTGAMSDSVEKLAEAYPEMAAPFRGNLQEFGRALPWLQCFLRLAWDTPDDRYRGWYLHEVRRFYRDAVVPAEFAKEEPRISNDLFSAIPSPGIPRELTDKRLIDPPAITPFEGAVFYFQSRIGDRAKHCRHANCAEPYFIAEKRWQKFCSEACAGPANKESKRKWWSENRGKGAK